MSSKCMNEDILYRYIDDSISDQEREQAEEHFSECDDCREKLVIEKLLSIEDELTENDQEATEIIQAAYKKAKQKLKAYTEWRPDSPPAWLLNSAGHGLASDGLQSGFFRKIKDNIKDFFKWLLGSQTSEADLGYAGLRFRRAGSQAETVSSQDSILLGTVHIKKKTDDMVVEMYFEKTGDDSASISVTVFQDSKIAQNVSLSLFSDKGRSSSFLRDFEVFEKLPFGTYRLIIKQNKQEKVNYLFEIDDEGFHEKEYNFS